MGVKDMQTDELRQKMEALEALHEKVQQKVEDCADGEKKKEYRGKTTQYLDMFGSLDTMKKQSDREDVREGLEQQQLLLLDKWIAFEEKF